MYELGPSNIWQHEMSYIDEGRPPHMAHARINERLLAGQQLRFWVNNRHIPYIQDESLPNHLANLLGYVDYGSLMRGHDNRVSELLQALVGPHGFAIYKALVIRSSNDELESE